MKTKLLLLSLLTGIGAAAQDLRSVQRMMAASAYDSARLQIDGMLADARSPRDPALWFYKGKIYTGLAGRNTASPDTGLIAQAFEAFRKYEQSDPKNRLMFLDQNIGLFQLYNLTYDAGIRQYNDGDYNGAWPRFRKAVELKDYIYARGLEFKGFSFPALDTQLVHLAATSAYLSGHVDESIPLFEKLADAGLSGEDFKGIYGVLAEYHIRRDDPVRSTRYISMGKRLFPDDRYWSALESKALGKDTLKRLARYEELVARYPDNPDLSLNYSIEAFNYTYGSGGHPADYAQRQQRTAKALEAAVRANPNSPLAAYVMAEHLHNSLSDLLEEDATNSGLTAAEQARKRTLASQIDSQFEALYRFSQKAWDLYSAQPARTDKEERNRREMARFLAEYYQRRNDAAKAAEYRALSKG